MCALFRGLDRRWTFGYVNRIIFKVGWLSFLP